MKKNILAAVLAAMIVLLTACSESSGLSDASSDTDAPSASDQEQSGVTGGSDGDISDASPDTSIDEKPGQTQIDVMLPASPIEITNDNVTNSIHLFDSMTDKTENSMFSPLSLNMVLGLLESGAGGSTETALKSYLGTENYADFAEDYMEYVRDRLNRESGPLFNKYRDVFQIANSMWAGKTFPISADYKQSISDKFGAELQNLDFNDSKNAAKTINKWVSDKTNKLIPEIVKEDQLNANTAAVLVNTVYFESGWVDEWEINEDNKQPFTLLDGSTKDIALMYNMGDVYYENDKATAFGCYYKNGLQFIGILPKDYGNFTLESLDIPSLLKSANSTEYDIAAKMPRLNFESDFPLNDALKSLGLEVIFDPGSADFSKMQEIDGDEFYVSDIIQKTKLELDEHGTKATAATAAIIAGNAAPIAKETRNVTLDRPFAFLIYDAENDQIAFMGKVTNP